MAMPLEQSPANRHKQEHAKGMSLHPGKLRERRASGGDLYFHRPRPQVIAIWTRTGFLDRLGRDHVFPDKQQAIAAIRPRLDPAVCARCTVRLFRECLPDDPGTAI